MVVALKLEKNPSGDKDNMMTLAVGAAWYALRILEALG